MPDVEIITVESEVNAERVKLESGVKLHWFHWCIIGLSALLTLFAAEFFNRQVQERAKVQFDREASLAIEMIKVRMVRYEDALWSGTAAIRSQGGAVSRSEWRIFSESLRIEEKYPGINGIGVIENVSKAGMSEYEKVMAGDYPEFRIHPAHSEPESLPIVYIEPEAPNRKAVGLDIAHEKNRLDAARKARRSGLAQITGPIVLVQDAGHTPGFLFYAPYYEGDLDAGSGRQGRFLGMVYAPFVVKQLMAGTLGQDARRIGISIRDNNEYIYDEMSSEDSEIDPNPQFSETFTLELYGRNWRIDVWSSSSFRQSTATSQPVFILFCGVTIDLLLLALFLLQCRANRRTLDFADRLTGELRTQTHALQESNRKLEDSNSDLERFAYVASHDLKTPLRGIRDLTSYLEEDLADYLSSSDCNSDVTKNFRRLYEQTKRMERQIGGILEYSSADGNDEIGLVEITKVLRPIAVELNLRSDQIVYEQVGPSFETYVVPFHQILANLVGNAFKYHPSFGDAVVTVACRDLGDWLEVSVRDNGAGIEPQYHERIFGAFQTLKSNDKIDSTGIGLAIVKRTVERLGGKIWVTSSMGEGSTFTFSWPKTLGKSKDAA